MAEKLNIFQKLQKVQFEMKAPKNLTNTFGKYKYRNCEGILEAFKPFGKKYGLVLTLDDSVFHDNGRFYVMATATLIDVDDPTTTITNSALARESAEKKGMDDSQITGTASSYARKYALNGLFLLDDTKDADTDEYHKQTNRKADENIKSVADIEAVSDDLVKIKDELHRTGVNEGQILKAYSVKKLEDLTPAQIMACLSKLEVIETKERK